MARSHKGIGNDSSPRPLEVYYGADGFAFQAFWRSGKEAEVLEALEQFAKAVRKQADREDARRFKVGLSGTEAGVDR